MTEPRSARFSFTQPICGTCYVYRYPGREPSRVGNARVETCCDCYTETRAGIYVRVDPASVRNPTKAKD